VEKNESRGPSAFEAAVELPTDQRVEYLESQATEPEVRRAVSLCWPMLIWPSRFLRMCSVSAAASILGDLDLRPGTRVGAFTIVRMLGRGGMGAVYLAERTDGGFEQPSPSKSFNRRIRTLTAGAISARTANPGASQSSNIARLWMGRDARRQSPLRHGVCVRRRGGRYCDRHAMT